MYQYPLFSREVVARRARGFMGSLHGAATPHWDHESVRTTFCCICNKRLQARKTRFMKEASMLKELGDGILACDLPEHGLSAGDIGTVVLVHRNAAGYEVEFTSLDGDTIAVVTLMANQVRPVQAGAIAHMREMAAK